MDTRKEIAGLLEAFNLKVRWNQEDKARQERFFNEFKKKRNWGLFLQRHGIDTNWENFKDGHQVYRLHFLDKSKCEIEANDYFRGECANSGWTRAFPIQELINFMESDDYYAPVLSRLERYRKFLSNKEEEESKKRRLELYHKLKEEFGEA